MEISPAASQLQTALPLSCRSSPGLWGGFAEKCMLNARALSFLPTLCSLPQHLEFKCFTQWPGSSLFCWKMLSFPQKPTTAPKTQVVSLWKVGGKSYSVWCLGKRKRKQMLLNYKKWIECGGRTRLSRVQTTQDGAKTLFTMELLQDVPSPQQRKGTEIQLSGMLSFIHNRALENMPLKYSHTQILQLRNLFVILFIYLRPLLSNSDPF